MKFSQNQGKFLNQVISEWETNGTISQTTAEALKGSFSVRKFDWKKLAMYSFWVSMACAIIAVSAILADDFFVHMFELLFSSSDVIKSVFVAILAVVMYFLGLRFRKSQPKNIYSNESLMFSGVLLTAVAVGYLGRAIDNGSGHFSLLFLFSTILYAGLGLWFPSKLVWIFAVLALGCWFGTETGYESGWEAYYLGMNYPLRFVGFGAVLVGASFLLKLSSKLNTFFKITYILGMLYLFVSLWLMSIFGNYGTFDQWLQIKQYALFHWGLVFGLMAMAAIYYGLKNDDYTSRSFGITFLFINLYTRYFEYFWDTLHKAVFFLILAASFWILGKWSEKIWNVDFFKNPSSFEDLDHDEL